MTGSSATVYTYLYHPCLPSLALPKSSIYDAMRHGPTDMVGKVVALVVMGRLT